MKKQFSGKVAYELKRKLHVYFLEGRGAPVVAKF